MPELCECDQYDSSMSSNHSCGGSIDSEVIESSIRSCLETDKEDTLDDSGVECHTQYERPPSAGVNGNQNNVTHDQRGNDVDRDTSSTTKQDP